MSRQVEGPDHRRPGPLQHGDIDRAWEALKDAPQPRIHVFLATSAIHREFKLKMAKEEIIQPGRRGREAGARAVATTSSSRPRTRRAPSSTSCARWSRRPSRPGATTVNIPDTVGYATARPLRRDHPPPDASACRNIDKAVISVHCHNDLGLAVANILAGVEAGARQVECTINGIGERAGNCSLEEIVMALQDAPRLLQAPPRHQDRAALPDQPAGVAASPACTCSANKAIVGQNAFAHEAGIHQDGMLKDRDDLRDHAARGRRLRPQPAWCWASTPAGTPSRSG